MFQWSTLSSLGLCWRR